MQGINLLFSDLKKFLGNWYSVVLVLLILSSDLLSPLLGNLLTQLLIYIVALLLFVKILKKYLRKTDKRELKKVHGRLDSFFNRKNAAIIFGGGFIVFAVFMGGLYLGYNIGRGDTSSSPEKAKSQANYLEVIDSYEQLSRLFYYQGQDMDIITNPSIIENNPEEFRDALVSYQQKKDEILFLYGRIYEKRERANLSHDPFIKTE